MEIRKFIPLLALTLLLTGSAAQAQTTTTNGTTVTTPGVPSTGAGGAMPANLALLGASAVIGLVSAAYLLRRRGA